MSKKEIRRLRKSSTVKTMSSVKTVSFPFFQFLSSVCILSDYYDHIHLCHSVSLLIQNHPHLSAYPHVYLALLFQIIQIVVGFELNTAPFCPSHFTSPATEIPRSQPTETDFKWWEMVWMMGVVKVATSYICLSPPECFIVVNVTLIDLSVACVLHIYTS